MVTSAVHREIVQDWMQCEGATERQACRLLGFSRSVNKYSQNKTSNAVIEERIEKLKANSKTRRYGVPRLTAMLRREGLIVNHKRVRRICKQFGLMVKKKRRPKIRTVEGLSHLPIAKKPNDVWAMDFVSDKFQNKKAFRSLTIVDICTRICPGIYVAETMREFNFIELLSRLKARKTLPRVFILDNGTEFTSNRFTQWCKENGIHIFFIDKGCPTQNAYIESFNGKFRDECLNEHTFNDVTHARRQIEVWRNNYNYNRPHSSLDYQTPMEYLSKEVAHSI